MLLSEPGRCKCDCQPAASPRISYTTATQALHQNGRGLLVVPSSHSWRRLPRLANRTSPARCPGSISRCTLQAHQTPGALVARNVLASRNHLPAGMQSRQIASLSACRAPTDGWPPRLGDRLSCQGLIQRRPQVLARHGRTVPILGRARIVKLAMVGALQILVKHLHPPQQCNTLFSACIAG